MTNTKFRKRALLSSVAMLLVAMLALGSATFAWFTSDPTADSTGIKMNTSTSTGLLAKAVTDTGDFSHHTGLNNKAAGNFELQPASLDAGAAAITKYYTATADDEDSYASTGAITGTNISASDSAAQTSGVYAERIYLKTTGAASNTATVHSINVTLDQTGITETMKSAVRVAILDKNNALIGIWGANGNTYAHDTSGTVAFTDSSTKYSVQSAAVDPSLAITGNGTANWVTVVVYLDGEDATCKTTNVTNAAALLNGFTVAFSL